MTVISIPLKKMLLQGRTRETQTCLHLKPCGIHMCMKTQERATYMHMHKHQCMHTSTHQQGLVHVNMFRHMYMHASSCTAQMYKVTHEHTCTEILPEPNGTWKFHGYGGGCHYFILATKFNLPLPRLSPAPQANLRPPLQA